MVLLKVDTISKRQVETAPEYDAILLRRFAETTALVCYNDLVAVGVMETLRRNGLVVPANISIVGIEDSSLASLTHPKLTTVAHPRSLLGTLVAHRIIHLMDKSDDVFSEILPPILIIRSSVSPPAFVD